MELCYDLWWTKPKGHGQATQPGLELCIVMMPWWTSGQGEPSQPWLDSTSYDLEVKRQICAAQA